MAERHRYRGRGHRPPKPYGAGRGRTSPGTRTARGTTVAPWD